MPELLSQFRQFYCFCWEQLFYYPWKKRRNLVVACLIILLLLSIRCFGILMVHLLYSVVWRISCKRYFLTDNFFNVNVQSDLFFFQSFLLESIETMHVLSSYLNQSYLSPPNHLIYDSSLFFNNCKNTFLHFIFFYVPLSARFINLVILSTNMIFMLILIKWFVFNFLIK